MISNSEGGRVIHSISGLLQSDVPSSIILNPFSTLLFHDNSDPMDISVEPGVIINSPRILYLPRNPPIPRLPSVSISSSSIPSIVLDEIPIPAWPSHYSKVFKLYNSSSFNEKGCIIPKPYGLDLFTAGLKNLGIVKDNTSVTLSEYFHYSLSSCSTDFCTTHLKCCFLCGLTSHCELTLYSDKRILCIRKCSDCPSSDHCFHSCPKFLSWLHDPKSPYHSTWLRIVTKWISSHPPPDFKN